MSPAAQSTIAGSSLRRSQDRRHAEIVRVEGAHRRAARPRATSAIGPLTRPKRECRIFRLTSVVDSGTCPGPEIGGQQKGKPALADSRRSIQKGNYKADGELFPAGAPEFAAG
jgi:hypothetical protein